MILPSFSKLNPITASKDLSKLLDKFKQQIQEAISLNMMPLELLNLFDQQGNHLERFWSPCSHMNAVIGSDEWRKCYDESIGLLSAFDTFVHQNKDLYRLLDVTDESLSSAQKKMQQDFLLNCRLSGINLEDSKRKKIESLSEELDKLSQKFQNHVTDSQKQFRFETENLEDLEGLPEHIILNAKNRAQEEKHNGYVLALDQPTYMAVVSYAKNRSLRQMYVEAYGRRASQAPYDNTGLIQKILSKRHQFAQLLGLGDYVEYSLSTKMAKKLSRVESFLQGLLLKVKPVAEKDIEILKEFAASKGHIGTLEPWDTAYYMQQRQQEIFSIDQEALRDFFPLSQVMKGLDSLLQKLYGLHLQKQENIDVWHEDVEVYALCQADKTIGWVYCDWFTRTGKRSGAWMDTLQTHCVLENELKQLPMATLTCNFAKPIPGKQAGLTHEELLTLLHEFGHCFHHLLSEVQEFSVSGVHGVEWDAVELPSQWMENWGWEEAWVQQFSRHIETGQSLPHEQFLQLLAMKNDMVGLFLLRQLLFAIYDMKIHSSLPPQNATEVNAQYLDLLEQYAVWPFDKEQRFPQSFSHIFAGGYAAGYYSYLWADVLSNDAFAWFSQHMDEMSTCGQKFRKTILARGGSCSALDAFIDFRGREPDEKALLKAYGLMS